MNRFHNTALTLGAVLNLSAVAYAQEVQEPTMPEVAPELTEEEKVWQRRFEKAEGFRTRMLQTRRGVEMFYSFQKRNAENILENREKCQEDLRRSNRDTKFSAILHCFRRELVLNIELREKQRQYVESIPGVSDELRGNALLVLDDLISALSALLEGVESDVFQDTEDLIEAKKNLHTAFRVPALLAVLRVEADRGITWVAHLMHRLLIMTQNTELGPDAFTKTSEALSCFGEGETQLMSISAIEGLEDSNYVMNQALKGLRSCSDLLEEAHVLQQLFENPPVEEEENRDGLSPRRRWKNI